MLDVVITLVLVALPLLATMTATVAWSMADEQDPFSTRSFVLWFVMWGTYTASIACLLLIGGVRCGGGVDA